MGVYQGSADIRVDKPLGDQREIHPGLIQILSIFFIQTTPSTSKLPNIFKSGLLFLNVVVFFRPLYYNIADEKTKGGGEDFKVSRDQE